MKLGQSIFDFFLRTMEIINKIQIHGDKIEDVKVIEKILRSMTSKFNYVVCSIEESKNLDQLSIDELQGSLLVREHKLIEQDNEVQALKASTNYNATTQNQLADRGGGKGGRGNRDACSKREGQGNRGRGRANND